MVHVSTCSRSNMFTLYPFKEEAATKNVPKPQKSSNRPIFRRLYTVGRRSAIRSFEFLKFCSFGTMLPTLWDSQTKVLGPIGQREKFETPSFVPFRALFGLPEADTHSANLPLVIYHASGVRHIPRGLFPEPTIGTRGSLRPLTGSFSLGPSQFNPFPHSVFQAYPVLQKAWRCSR